ncbi:Zinc ABC transporter, periplasmic-binding protein ZnuA [hydrothermal vent metagenome]|uniref:Zinc ABC transporter, periplasmic-binding protein ZnuA n=1 Tax=hydrothermal vent metagenome TaxID=652676 RepID=A0A1W1E9A2_9ZZZZ
MKQILLLFIGFTAFILANINTVVSILPEQTFVKAIGGEKVKVTLMVTPGNSPHTYEPKPSQMKAVAKAQLYFAIGVEFEKRWLPQFKDLNPTMKIVDLSTGIEKMPMAAHHHEEEHHKASGLDPHIWTAPKNVAHMAQRIFDALVLADPQNSDYYKANLDAFLAKIKETDTRIKTYLSPLPKGTAFMVFHPSWGYFAKAYGLRQLPIEIEGKNPKPRELISVIKAAKKAHVRAIFTQPEFSDASAKIIADELHIPVIKVSPLTPDWSENLVRIAKAIAGVQ